MMLQHRERPQYSLLDIIFRRRWVAIATLIVGLIALTLVVLHVKPKYGAMTHVLLVNDPAGRDPITASFDMPTIATSTSVVEAVKRRLGLSASVADIQGGITAHVSPRSSIMTIAYRSKDPREAIDISNGVADEFISFYATLPSKRSEAVVKAYSDQLKAVRAQIGRVEASLEGAAVGRTYVGTQSSLDNLAGELGTLRQQRGVAESQLVSDQSDLASDRSQPARTAKIVRAEILQNDRPYRQLSTDVAHDQSQFTTTLAGVTDQYPGIAGFEDKVKKEEQAVARARVAALESPDAYSPSQGGQVVATDKATAAVAGDATRVSALDSQIAGLEDELRESSQQTQGYPSLGNLRVQRDTLEARYAALTTRFAGAQSNAAESNSLGQAIVVDRAIKAEPSLIGPRLILIVGAIVVLLAAAGFAYLAELIDPKLLTPVDVESLYGRPSLGSLRNS